MPRRVKETPLDQLFAALANPTRRDILDALRAGDRSAGDLARLFEMSRPSVSEHLRALREAGLVEERAVGRQRIYRVTAAPLADLAGWLSPYERFWRDRLTALGEVVDRMGPE
ncbi:ArsR/SmtB family transcription factor [Phytohabitans houttuyneae]|uniref:Transcriptional regulator n=1 Tax=Phytohabitans houttuyneae TaxID=1076126 RepID=A0A6V8KPQ0_9ACTN|nr:metalloregulator ArsR/SmtB family transcription factor [Phytohabitans houttuyneae]GFJ84199.1 transcriptional regulator [Phytohabitans houttuyneae]